MPKALEVAVAEDHGLPAPETLDILAGERPADAEPAIDSHGGVDELERVGAFGLLDRCPDFRQACEEYELYAGEQHVNLAGRLRDVMSRVSSIIPALAARGLNISQLEDSLHKLDIARCDLRCAFSVVTTPATQNSYVFTLTTMPAPDEKDFRSWLSTTAIESDALAHDLSPYASERAILPLRHAAGVLRAVAKRLPK